MPKAPYGYKSTTDGQKIITSLLPFTFAIFRKHPKQPPQEHILALLQLLLDVIV